MGRNHSTGQKITDWQLLELKHTLTKELGDGDLKVTPENLRKVFAHTGDSFLSLVRQLLGVHVASPSTLMSRPAWDGVCFYLEEMGLEF